jgi:hypothetical protein
MDRATMDMVIALARVFSPDLTQLDEGDNHGRGKCVVRVAADPVPVQNAGR